MAFVDDDDDDFEDIFPVKIIHCPLPILVCWRVSSSTGVILRYQTGAEGEGGGP